MTTTIALLRGVNVGRAKRVAMADLRALVEGLGYRDVRTVLNSGNVLFDAPARPRGDPGARIARALAAELGVEAPVIALRAVELARALEANPFARLADDPSRLLVGVLADAGEAGPLARLARERWDPERLAVEGRFAYLWCPSGTLGGRLFEAVDRALGSAVTTRTLATMRRIAALADG